MTGNVTLARTKRTIDPKLRIINALVKNTELEQYKMPEETTLSYRTILRTLKPMENEDTIKVIRTEMSKKGGKEKKIYVIQLKGFLTYLNSLIPQNEDFQTQNGYHSSLERATEIIVKKIQPFTINEIINIIENLGNRIDLKIFKQIRWLVEHYGLDVFRAIIYAASATLDRDRTPSLEKISQRMLAEGEKQEKVKLQIKRFQDLNSYFFHEAFLEEFANRFIILEGKGNLHNDILEQLFAELASETEKKCQRTIAPIKGLAQTFK
jgi:hypothetical protein